MSRTTASRYRLAGLIAVAYVALAVLANWLASRWTVPVGLGRHAPAGVWAIGGTLVFRDWLQQLASHLSFVLIPFAAGASYLIGDAAGWTSLQKIAVGSLAAFCVSELVEAAVFTPWRKRSLTFGVLLSGTAGAALDSYVFLTIAFGSLAYFQGQMIGKGEALAVGVALTFLRRVIVPVPAPSPA